MHSNGRPPKLTPEMEYRLCRLIAQGVPIGRAIDALGVSQTAVYAWIRKGRRPEVKHRGARVYHRNPLYERLVESLDAAYVERESLITEIVEQTIGGGEGV